ncbi:MAG: hypothetical protein K8R48_10195 [Alphaproteobacteria bacterium]|nr:hypothetical protein [Alphaproteobacteria bacterium]
MEQKTIDRFLSAFIGAGLGVIATAVAVFTGIVAASVAVAGVVAVALVPSILLAATAAYRLEKGAFRPITAVVSGLAVLLSGMGMGYSIRKLPAHQHTTDKAPIENTRSVSFLDHKDGFNAAARNGKKTLVLTAKDFSRAPATAAKSLTA